jgi:hypothetical protein
VHEREHRAVRSRETGGIAHRVERRGRVVDHDDDRARARWPAPTGVRGRGGSLRLAYTYAP